MNVLIVILLGAAISFLALMVAAFYYENKGTEITEEEEKNWKMTLADKLAELDKNQIINDTNYVETKNKK